MTTASTYQSRPALLSRSGPGPFTALTVYWAVFAISASAYVVHYFLGSGLPWLSATLSVASLVSCGLAWLLSRALFRVESQRVIWPQLIVAILFVAGLILQFSSGNNSEGMLGYIYNIQAVIGSTVLLMTLIEPIDYRGNLKSEKRFRACFSAGYLAILAVAFLARLPEFDVWQLPIQVSLATLALIGASAAVLYRRRHPLAASSKHTSTHKRAVVEPNPVLAAALKDVLDKDQLFLTPDIKVADVAKRLGQPEYKVSQCIVTDLGFANFNQWINTYRIADARRRLSSPDFDDCSILVISMDCGFASLGPFNRAFKADTGSTPSKFRECRVKEELGAENRALAG